jgi:ATP-dependent Lon protease
VLLGLLEPGTARGFEDSFLRQAVNMSFINWILTANDLDAVSAPVRDRCLVVHIDAPSPADFEYLARRQIEERGLDPELIHLILRGFRSGQIKSLRRLNKVLDAAEAALARPMLN